MKITTDLATAENAGCVTCNGNARYYRRSGDRLVTPSSADMSSNIAAAPSKNRDGCDPRPSHSEICCERRIPEKRSPIGFAGGDPDAVECREGKLQGSSVPKVASLWHEPGRVVVSLVAHR